MTDNRSIKLNAVIDASIQKEKESQGKRDYLGTSLIGKPCSRQIQYIWQNTETDLGRELPSRIYRIFDIGNTFEDLTITWLKTGGITLITENINHEQFGFAKGKLKGHIDGKITNGPEFMKPFPRLWECKSMNNNKFTQFITRGVKYSHIQYFVQVQIYMKMMNLTKNAAVLTGVQKETASMHHEFIKYEKETADKYIKRASNIIDKTEKKQLMPRISSDRNNFECKYCSWQTRCWSTND